MAPYGVFSVGSVVEWGLELLSSILIIRFGQERVSQRQRPRRDSPETADRPSLFSTVLKVSMRYSLTSFISVVFLTATAIAADRIAVLSDDGEVVTVVKVPNALELADFSKHLGIVAAGTKARILGAEKKDPVVPAKWVEVQILEGQHKGKTGWVLTQVVHDVKEVRPPDGPRTSRQHEEKSLDVNPDAKDAPKRATHFVQHATAIFSDASILAASSKRVSSGDWVEKHGDKPDETTSFYWVQVSVLSGKLKGAKGWLPSHTLKEICRCKTDETAYPKTREWAERNFPGLKKTKYGIVKPRTTTNCFGYVLGIHSRPVNTVYPHPVKDGATDEVKTLLKPYGYMDETMKRRGYQPRKSIKGADLDSVPSGTVLVYEGPLYQGTSPVNANIPRHVAILGKSGCWEAVTGNAEPLIYHQDPQALAGRLLGRPKWMYLPSKKT